MATAASALRGRVPLDRTLREDRLSRLEFSRLEIQKGSDERRSESSSRKRFVAERSSVQSRSVSSSSTRKPASECQSAARKREFSGVLEGAFSRLLKEEGGEVPWEAVASRLARRASRRLKSSDRDFIQRPSSSSSSAPSVSPDKQPSTHAQRRENLRAEAKVLQRRKRRDASSPSASRSPSPGTPCPPLSFQRKSLLRGRDSRRFESPSVAGACPQREKEEETSRVSNGKNLRPPRLSAFGSACSPLRKRSSSRSTLERLHELKRNQLRMQEMLARQRSLVSFGGFGAPADRATVPSASLPRRPVSPLRQMRDESGRNEEVLPLPEELRRIRGRLLQGLRLARSKALSSHPSPSTPTRSATETHVSRSSTPSPTRNISRTGRTATQSSPQRREETEDFAVEGVSEQCLRQKETEAESAALAKPASVVATSKLRESSSASEAESKGVSSPTEEEEKMQEMKEMEMKKTESKEENLTRQASAACMTGKTESPLSESSSNSGERLVFVPLRPSSRGGGSSTASSEVREKSSLKSCLPSASSSLSLSDEAIPASLKSSLSSKCLSAADASCGTDTPLLLAASSSPAFFRQPVSSSKLFPAASEEKPLFKNEEKNCVSSPASAAKAASAALCASLRLLSRSEEAKTEASSKPLHCVSAPIRLPESVGEEEQLGLPSLLETPCAVGPHFKRDSSIAAPCQRTELFLVSSRLLLHEDEEQSEGEATGFFETQALGGGSQASNLNFQTASLDANGEEQPSSTAPLCCNSLSFEVSSAAECIGDGKKEGLVTLATGAEEAALNLEFNSPAKLVALTKPSAPCKATAAAMTSPSASDFNCERKPLASPSAPCEVMNAIQSSFQALLETSSFLLALIEGNDAIAESLLKARIAGLTPQQVPLTKRCGQRASPLSQMKTVSSEERPLQVISQALDELRVLTALRNLPSPSTESINANLAHSELPQRVSKTQTSEDGVVAECLYTAAQPRLPVARESEAPLLEPLSNASSQSACLVSPIQTASLEPCLSLGYSALPPLEETEKSSLAKEVAPSRQSDAAQTLCRVEEKTAFLLAASVTKDAKEEDAFSSLRGESPRGSVERAVTRKESLDQESTEEFFVQDEALQGLPSEESQTSNAKDTSSEFQESSSGKASESVTALSSPSAAPQSSISSDADTRLRDGKIVEIARKPLQPPESKEDASAVSATSPPSSPPSPAPSPAPSQPSSPALKKNGFKKSRSSSSSVGPSTVIPTPLAAPPYRPALRSPPSSVGVCPVSAETPAVASSKQAKLLTVRNTTKILLALPNSVPSDDCPSEKALEIPTLQLSRQATEKTAKASTPTKTLTLTTAEGALSPPRCASTDTRKSDETVADEPGICAVSGFSKENAWGRKSFFKSLPLPTQRAQSEAASSSWLDDGFRREDSLKRHFFPPRPSQSAHSTNSAPSVRRPFSDDCMQDLLYVRQQRRRDSLASSGLAVCGESAEGTCVKETRGGTGAWRAKKFLSKFDFLSSLLSSRAQARGSESRSKSLIASPEKLPRVYAAVASPPQCRRRAASLSKIQNPGTSSLSAVESHAQCFQEAHKCSGATVEGQFSSEENVPRSRRRRLSSFFCGRFRAREEIH